MILVFDFGSQTCHLIGRRLRDLGVEVKILDPGTNIKKIKKLKPKGVIFSGGPASVYEKKAPSIGKEIFGLKAPILGICYGWQLMAKLLGGKVGSGKKEYGPTNLRIKDFHNLFYGFPDQCQVWHSHGDTVVKIPPGFKSLAKTDRVRYAAVCSAQKRLFGVQFHPEVSHTEEGTLLLKNFSSRICGLPLKPKSINIPQLVEKVREKVGSYKVVGAVSGGVDSTTTAALIARAIGKKFIPIYIENGLMREGAKKEVKQIFNKEFRIKPTIIEAKNFFLKNLKGILDPEKKRQIIGKLYIDLFEKEAKKIKGVKFLAQGTIYSDVIESKGTRKASKIKSHHNVGALPKRLDLKLIEPLRFFYKDEVREIGRKLGLPDRLLYKQPFPGPGQAIRIIGEVTKKRLRKQQQADQIVLEELKKASWLKKVFQSFPVMTGVKSTAVKGDHRFYGEVVGLRIYDSSDIMTASWSKLPYGLLQKISLRIVNEIPGISRVVYDITTKPPATMEWE